MLTTGTYRRLPTGIKVRSLPPNHFNFNAPTHVLQKLIEPVPPLTDAQVLQTLRETEDIIRYRLRMDDLIPIEMSEHRIGK